MLQSMTSFGQSLLNTAWGDLNWEIRSVNHRHLDITIRLPDALRCIEARVRAAVVASVERGKIDVFLKFNEKAGGIQQLVLNHHVLEQLGDAIDQVQAMRGDVAHCDPVSVLQWPGVVSIHSVLDDALVEQAMSSFDQALADFCATRLREGEQIVQMLEARAARLAVLIAQLREHRPDIIVRQKEKLVSKLVQLDVEHDPARLAQELVYAAQRLDIDEEIDRISAHLQELARVLERTGAVGRRLDFLMQELNREANTIASKSSDSDTTAVSIDMKVLVEQIREQVQNVE